MFRWFDTAMSAVLRRPSMASMTKKVEKLQLQVSSSLAQCIQAQQQADDLGRRIESSKVVLGDKKQD